MLKRLYIEQFVIIEKLDLELQPGLSILTGETGAGKSILLDAFLLILGDPSHGESIRQGSDQSIIEGTLTPPPENPVWKLMVDNQLGQPSDGQIIIRRVVKRKKWDEQLLVNGKPVKIDLLKKMGKFLGEIHGQNANATITDPVSQMAFLDMSGACPPEAYQNVVDALTNLRRLEKEKEEEIAFLNANSRDLGAHEEMLKRFEPTGLMERKIEDLRAEYTYLLTAYETSEAFQDITGHLVASTGAIRILSAANLALTRQQNLDKDKMKNLATFLEAALENARNAASETNRLAPEYAIDTKPLHKLKEQLAAMEPLMEELGIPMEDLSLFLEDLTTKVNRIRGAKALIAELEERIKEAQEVYKEHAHILTEYRIVAGQGLSKDVNAELPRLKLQRAEFEVQVEEAPDDPWTELGFNRVIFTARMNPGMPFSPISETASGGELARLVLSIKITLQAVQKTPTLVFDEVDVGIGGAAAAALGERIAFVADTTQVIVITHSPQVAARGDQHLYVSKKVEDGVTKSVVRTLTLDERIDEISRMLAGDQLTAESRSAAKMLIDEAVAAGEARRNALRKVS